jgi:hypothetical protein
MWNGPGSAVHHSCFALALHRIRDTRVVASALFLAHLAGRYDVMVLAPYCTYPDPSVANVALCRCRVPDAVQRAAVHR